MQTLVDARHTERNQGKARCNNEEFNLPIGKQVVAIDAAYFRPTEVDLLIGDATKAKTKLGWVPVYTLDMLVKEMMQSDVAICRSYGEDHVMQLESF